MTDTLKPCPACPLCGKPAEVTSGYAGCSDAACVHNGRLVPLEDWRAYPRHLTDAEADALLGRLDEARWECEACESSVMTRSYLNDRHAALLAWGDAIAAIRSALTGKSVK